MTNYVSAAIIQDGSLMVAYTPPAHTGSIVVNMTALSDKMYVYWFDSTSGKYIPIANPPFNKKGIQSIHRAKTVPAKMIGS